MGQKVLQSPPLPLRNGSSSKGSRDEGCCGYVKVSNRCGACHSHRVEGVCGQESARQFGSSGHQGGEEIWQVHHPWLGHDQDSHEACVESGKREVFGKVVMVKAKPATKVVKA